MFPPRLQHATRVVVFGAVLLASSSIRESPAGALDQAVIWLPTGVAVAGLWFLGLRQVWMVALCTLIQRRLLGYDLGVSLPAAVGSSAEAVLGVVVLRRLDFRNSLSRLRDVGALLAAASIAPLASILFSWVGRSFFWSNPSMPFYSGWGGWWRMNALGLLTVVPVAATWLSIPRRELSPRVLLGAAVALIGIPSLFFAALTLVPPGITGIMSLNLVLALVLYAAVRFGIRGATLSGALAALTVAIATTHGFGPFLALPRDQRHLSLQLFELIFVAILPAFGALIAERQAAQERGVRSDALRRSIQSAMLDVIYRIRRDGVFLDVSAPPGAPVPAEPRLLIGSSVFEQFPPGHGARLRRAVEHAFAIGEPATVEYEITIGGRRRVREARCVPHGDDEMLAVVRDITDRKWSEGTTAFEARVLALVATGRPPAEVFAEIVGGMERLTVDGLCSIIVIERDRMHVAMAPSLPAEFNRGVEGVTIGPMVGSCGAAASLGRTIIVRDIATDPLWKPYRHSALAHGLRACWSVPIRDSAGSVLGTFAVYYREIREPEPQELALADRAAALAGIVLERERRGDALRRSEDLLASINRNVKEGLFRTSAGLEVRYANRALARLFGYGAPEELYGRALGETIVDARRLEELRWLLAEQGQWLNEEVRFQRRDGSPFWGLLSATAVPDADGAIAHVDGAITDITARKELEEQFRQSQKMEAVGKLAGGVAHDFNNLLTVIIGYADAIRGRAGEPERIRANAEQVLAAATRASGLTRQLLAYSRQQVLSPQVLELTAVVEQMGDMLRRLIGEDIALVIEHRSGPCWVRVDRSQTEQVLLNLVVNARDAMPGGGTLTVTTAPAQLDAAEARAWPELPAGAYVALKVRDTGTGMPPEVQARAFDPFFTTKGPGKGTGLGLSTVYGIVKQSGGAVWIESAPGAGTKVSIYLPRWAAPVELPAPPALAPGVPAVATVLVVEDEPEVRELVCGMLGACGYRVLEAADGVKALEVARAHADGIDLVVCDVVMPRLGGPEMAKRLLAARPGLRFLFISGYPDDVRDAHDFAGSAGDFLPKPFTPEQLTDRVGAILRPGVVGA